VALPSTDSSTFLADLSVLLVQVLTGNCTS